MPQERLSIRKIRDVLRYRHSAGLSLEAIARALKISKGVVAKYLRLASTVGLTWPIPETLDDSALEKLLYRHGAARRRLPMTQMEPVMVMGPDGPVHLHEVFEGRRMLNLAARDVLYAVFSSGPVNELIDYRDFMGWQTPWYSTADAGAVMTTRNGGDLRCYLRVDDQVFKTYETKWRGIEAMLPTLQLLDLTAFGRQETWEDSPAGWPQDEAGSWWERDGRPVAQWTRTNAPIK